MGNLKVDIYGFVWATVNGINEYEDNEILDLIEYDFDEWGFSGNDEPSILVTISRVDGRLLKATTFKDLREALREAKSLLTTGWERG